MGGCPSSSCELRCGHYYRPQSDFEIVISHIDTMHKSRKESPGETETKGATQRRENYSENSPSLIKDEQRASDIDPPKFILDKFIQTVEPRANRFVADMETEVRNKIKSIQEQQIKEIHHYNEMQKQFIKSLMHKKVDEEADSDNHQSYPNQMSPPPREQPKLEQKLQKEESSPEQMVVSVQFNATKRIKAFDKMISNFLVETTSRKEIRSSQSQGEKGRSILKIKSAKARSTSQRSKSGSAKKVRFSSDTNFNFTRPSQKSWWSLV